MFYFQSMNSFNVENIATSQLMGRKQRQKRMPSVSYKAFVVYVENNFITNECLLGIRGNERYSVPLPSYCDLFYCFKENSRVNMRK